MIGRYLGSIALMPFILLGFSRSEAKEFTFNFEHVLEVGEETSLELTYNEGQATIISNDYGKVIIEAVKKVDAVSLEEAQELQALVDIRVGQSDNKVVVSANYLLKRNQERPFWKKILGLGTADSRGEVFWTISVPHGFSVDLAATSGPIEISHIRGSISVSSSSSDIALSSIEGPVEIENLSGKTKGDLIFGDVDVRQPKGEIDLQWIEGDIRVKSSSAKIAIRQERGALDLTTSTGCIDIQTNLDSSRDYFVATESGNIRLNIPGASSGKLNIISETGEIRTEIPIAVKSMTRKQLVGEFGLGGVKISLSSVSGDVTVAQF